MFKKVLVANRGLVAVNCVRAIRELGAKAAVVYEAPDLGSAAVRAADEAVEIKSTDQSTAYLDINCIVAAAVKLQVDAVHPGYGFLATNFELFKRLQEHKITLITTPSFPQAFELAKKADFKTLPTSPTLHSWNEVETHVSTIGFPLVVRALANYGGWGARIVFEQAELKTVWEHVCSQCERHGVPTDIVLQKYMPSAFQIEFPVLRDKSGQVLVLPDREVSVQRRFQKFMVETPAPNLNPDLRRTIVSKIPHFIDQLGLVGYAILVFEVVKGEAYLSEVESSVQAAHSATGLLTGVNILREQIRIASGSKLNNLIIHQEVNNHVIGVFVYAMDVFRKFTPSPGKVDRFHPPVGEGIYLHTSVGSGDTVSPHYDPVIAKLLVSDKTRSEAIARLSLALSDFFVDGIQTTLPLTRAIVESKDFHKAQITTSFLFSEAKRVSLLKSLRNPEDDCIAAIIAGLALSCEENSSQIIDNAQQGSLLWSMANRVLSRKKMEF